MGSESSPHPLRPAPASSPEGAGARPRAQARGPSWGLWTRRVEGSAARAGQLGAARGRGEVGNRGGPK